VESRLRASGAAGAPQTRYHGFVALLYLDVCCLKRPFDDQRSARIQAETAAIAALISRAESGELKLVKSPAHTYENDRNPREDRRLATAAWLNGARVEVVLSAGAAARARELQDLGFAPLDALHAAFAEESGADWLATTDDGMVALAREHAKRLRVKMANPIQVLSELTGGES
jgi:predicted nucleic acid-binding protein